MSGGVEKMRRDGKFKIHIKDNKILTQKVATNTPNGT